jgi:argininosuccinate synthase
MSHRILLAYSGGLDTSYCVIYLKAQGHEVHTVTADTGGFSSAEKARIEETAMKMGSSSHKTIDARQALFDGYLRYLIAGNVLRGGVYPLSVSAERVCQAKCVVDHAREMGATALAHGSTGAGNDQVRFEVAFRALASDLAVIAPIRDLAPSRMEEWEFLKNHGFEFPLKTADYSINEGMWGTSVGGKETHDPWQHLPEAAYPGGVIDPTKASQIVELAFEKGIPVSIDGQAMNPVDLIAALNQLGSSFGIGRGLHLGDTILGIKGRVGFEAPAAHLLITAHRELEKLVLSGKQLFWKESLGNLYGGLMHEGHFFDPLCRDLEAFLASSQEFVSGKVRLNLYPRAFEVQGVSSPFSMMRKDLASYGEGTALWSGAEAAGFTKIFGVPQQLARLAKQ